MRLRSVTIHNYRSIRHLEMTCEPMVVLLGANNHGKSNILAALEFALASSAKPAAGDFFALRDIDSDPDLFVELTFEALSDQERTTWKRYLLPGGVVRFRKTGVLGQDGTSDVRYSGYVRVYQEEFLGSAAIQTIDSREKLEQTPLVNFAPKGRFSAKTVEAAQEAYLEAHPDSPVLEGAQLESSPLMGQKNVAAGLLPDFYLIPAVKDLCDETKTKNTTLFGRLLSRAIKSMAEKDPRFSKLRSELAELVQGFNRRADGKDEERPSQLKNLEAALDGELGQWGVSVEIEVVPPAIDKLFELGTNLHVFDGVRTLAEQKGHGLQRAVLFALIRAWASALRSGPSEPSGPRARAASESIIFAIEEPELFLHPHAQRRLAKALEEMATTDGYQVFLCSHSSHFVDLDHYKRLVIAHKETPNEGTHVHQCTEELFEGPTPKDRKSRFHMAKWINPERGEIFFAKKAVFVEGETEATVLPFVGEKLGIFDPDVSIVDCGSKHNLPLYMAIAGAFKIPYIVLHDEDPIPDPVPLEWDESKRQSKARTFELNETIAHAVDPALGQVVMLKPDFEGAAGVSKSQGERKGKALAALEYFESLDAASVPNVLVTLVAQIYGAPVRTPAFVPAGSGMCSV